MDQQKVCITILARFPDINDELCQPAISQPNGRGILASGGRLIGQAQSVKLLAGLALFLLVTAVLPFCINVRSSSVDSLAACDSVAAKTTPAQNKSNALAVKQRPVVRIAAKQGSTSAPAKLPSMAKAPVKSQPASATEAPMMSNWPNPANMPLGLNNSEPCVAQPTATRTVEYQADTRSGLGQKGLSATRPENANENPANTNRHDSTRPSIH
jgi:hypothetical protein